MKKEMQGVSPVIGVLLLLGVMVAFVALTSNILFSIFDGSANPTVEIEVTHQNSGGSTTADILIVRNQNIDEFSYILDDRRCFIDPNNAVESGESFKIPDDGQTEGGTDCSGLVDLEAGDAVAVRGRVGSELYVLDNYRIPV